MCKSEATSCVIATGGLSAALIGAAVGASIATTAIAVSDYQSGNVRSLGDAAFGIAGGTLLGAMAGAAITGIPYIPAGLQAIKSAIADLAASTFIIPPLLPGLAGISGGTAVLGGVAISGQTILEGSAIITGVTAGNILWNLMQSANSNTPNHQSESNRPDKKDVTDESYTGGRTQEELDDLAKDPSHGNEITGQGIKEREIGLQLEERGDLGRIIRDPQADKGTEFIDTAVGIKWDVKSFESYPNGIISPRKGAFTVENAMRKILRELGNGHNVIVDTRNLIAEHVVQLKQAIESAGIVEKILWFP